MGTVRFSDPREFVEELGIDAVKVDRGLVRLTGLYQPTAFSPNVTNYSILATARVGKDILRLEHYCGQLWNINTESDEKVRKKGENTKEFLELACKGLELDIRAGVLEEGDD